MCWVAPPLGEMGWDGMIMPNTQGKYAKKCVDVRHFRRVTCFLSDISNPLLPYTTRGATNTDG